MKTYFFNVHTSEFKEYKIEAPNLNLALGELLSILLTNNVPFKVLRNYYCCSVRTIPSELYKKYFDGYSF